MQLAADLAVLSQKQYPRHSLWNQPFVQPQRSQDTEETDAASDVLCGFCDRVAKEIGSFTAARVLEHSGLEQDDFRRRGGYDVHAACVIYTSMNPRERSLLFLGKAEDAHTARAADFCRRNFAGSAPGGALGRPAAAGRGGVERRAHRELSRALDRACPAARAGGARLNFHPGPPEYPGYGCNNFAIYEGALEYGVTCHHMAPRVDTGAIVEVLRFPVLDSDNAGTLLARAYDFQLVLFYGVMGRIIRGEALPVSSETWSRQPFTRKQFSELGRLTAGMTEQEIAKRKRALDVGALKPVP